MLPMEHGQITILYPRHHMFTMNAIPTHHGSSRNGVISEGELSENINLMNFLRTVIIHSSYLIFPLLWFAFN